MASAHHHHHHVGRGSFEKPSGEKEKQPSRSEPEVQAVAAEVQPSLNRTKLWWLVYPFLVAYTALIGREPLGPLFTGTFLSFARFGTLTFAFLEQLILIDLAYHWNEVWVEPADQPGRIEYRSGSTLLRAIVATCIAVYALSIIGIVYLDIVFRGAYWENAWVITALHGIICSTAFVQCFLHRTIERLSSRTCDPPPGL